VNAVPLPSGGAVRFVGPSDGPVVVCMNGGVARAVPGDWSPSIEWLVGQLAPRFPEIGFAEVRYRIKSWRALDSLVADAHDAVAAVRARGASRLALLGFSAGGAASLLCAGQEGIREVIALAPWIPEQLELAPLDGARICVIHGSLDGTRVGVLGVHPNHSRAGVARLRAAGADASHTVIRGGVHGIAIRPFGRIVRLPHARDWRELVSEELVRFAGDPTA
jgi:dienelactone hydrolase